MIWSFLNRAVTATMGCLFGCFRIKDSSSHLVSQSLPSTTTATDVVAKKRNPLSSLLISEDGQRDDSHSKEKENEDLETTPQAEFDVKELKDEAKFLKACGTLSETPTEIRKLSREWKGQSGHKEEPENSKFRSWLTDTSIEKISLKMQPDQPPTPEKPSEELVKETVSLEQTPSSCMTDGQNTGRISSSSAEGRRIQNVTTPNEVHANQYYSSATSSASSRNLAPSVQCRNKSVRFDIESNFSLNSSRSSSSDIASENAKKSEVPGDCSVSKPSPYPTPLKLSDEMQTPGTVFPAYLDNTANRKKTRIRSQYVYSVLNPVENFSQWKGLKDEDYDSNQPSGQLGEPLEQVDEAGSMSEKEMRETSVEKELKVEASLSSWLKQPVTNQEGNNHFISRDNLHCGKRPADRPIIGMVAAHWSDDEPSRISPKWWDGNGIPNSTNKYKEDQKVSWHATPFEERLEKALSEETFISQRKHISGTQPIDFGENEESDTAVSKLESTANFNSIVSC